MGDYNIFNRPEIDYSEEEIFASIRENIATVEIPSEIEKLVSKKDEEIPPGNEGIDLLAGEYDTARAFSASRIRAREIQKIAKQSRLIVNELVEIPDIDTELADELTPETLGCIQAVASADTDPDIDKLTGSDTDVKEEVEKLSKKEYTFFTFIILILRMSVAAAANATLGYLCWWFRYKVFMPFGIHRAISNIFKTIERIVLRLVGFKCGSNKNNCAKNNYHTKNHVISFECCKPNGFHIWNNTCMRSAVRSMINREVLGDPPCGHDSGVYDWKNKRLKPGARINAAQKLIARDTLASIEEQQTDPALKGVMTQLVVNETRARSVENDVDQFDALVKSSINTKRMNNNDKAYAKNLFPDKGCYRANNTETLAKLISVHSIRYNLIKEDINLESWNKSKLDKKEISGFKKNCINPDNVNGDINVIMLYVTEQLKAKYKDNNLKYEKHVEALVNKLYREKILKKCNSNTNPGSYTLNCDDNYGTQLRPSTMSRLNNMYEQQLDESSYQIKEVMQLITYFRMGVGMICNIGMLLNMLTELLKTLLTYPSELICALFAGELSRGADNVKTNMINEIEGFFDELLETFPELEGGDPIFGLKVDKHAIEKTLKFIDFVESLIKLISIMQNGVSFEILNFKIPMEDMGKQLGENMTKVAAFAMDPVFGPVKNTLQVIRTAETPIGNVQSIPVISDFLNLVMCFINELQKYILDMVYQFFSNLGRDITITDNITITRHRDKWVLQLLSILDMLKKLLKQLAACNDPRQIQDAIIKEKSNELCSEMNKVKEAMEKHDIDCEDYKETIEFDNRDKERRESLFDLDDHPLGSVISKALYEMQEDIYSIDYYTTERPEGSLIQNEDLMSILNQMEDAEIETGYDPEKVMKILAERVNEENKNMARMLSL